MEEIVLLNSEDLKKASEGDCDSRLKLDDYFNERLEAFHKRSHLGDYTKDGS